MCFFWFLFESPEILFSMYSRAHRCSHLSFLRSHPLALGKYSFFPLWIFLVWIQFCMLDGDFFFFFLVCICLICQFYFNLFRESTFICISLQLHVVIQSECLFFTVGLCTVKYDLVFVTWFFFLSLNDILYLQNHFIYPTAHLLSSFLCWYLLWFHMVTTSNIVFCYLISTFVLVLESI